MSLELIYNKYRHVTCVPTNFQFSRYLTFKILLQSNDKGVNLVVKECMIQSKVPIFQRAAVRDEFRS